MAQKEKTAGKPALNEAAGIEKTDITAGYLGGTVYQNPDRTLQRQGAGLGMELYERVLRDPHIYACYQTRFLAVTGCERQVLPGAETPAAQRAAEFVQMVLDAVPLFDQVLFQLLHGVHYGFRIAEIMWEYSEGDVWVQSIISRRSKYFAFDIHGNPRLLTIASPIYGEELPERKFQRFVYPGGDDNPYGEGLGQRIYWWDWFKRNNTKFWVLFNEKFGSPTPVGKYPPGATDEQKKKLLEVLRSIQQESGIIVPENQVIEFLEAQRTTTVNTYQDFLSYCDEQISKCILGQTLTTEVGDTGSYAAAKTHKEVKDEIVRADADLLCCYLNSELVRWICDFNLPGLRREEYPTLWIKTEQGEDLNTAIDRHLKIARMVDVPKSFIYQTYDVPEPKEGEPVVVLGPGAEAPMEGGNTAPQETQAFSEGDAAVVLQQQYVQQAGEIYRQLLDDIDRSLLAAEK